MPKFLSRPHEITAVQWRGDNWPEIEALLDGARPPAVEYRAGIDSLLVYTLHGPVSCERGEWIVRGPGTTGIWVVSALMLGDLYESAP